MPRKYKWGCCNFIDHHLPLLPMSKTNVFINTTEDLINQFVIGYMINPTLHVNKVFIYKV